MMYALDPTLNDPEVVYRFGDREFREVVPGGGTIGVTLRYTESGSARVAEDGNARLIN
jgi:hypothetical protein